MDGEQVLVGTEADTVVSVGLEDGAWRWTYKREIVRTSLELAILGAPAPVVHDQLVLAGFSDGALVAMDRNSGAMRWEEPIGAGKFPDVQTEVIVDEGLAIVGSFGGPVVAIDIETQRQRWSNEAAGASGSMILAGDYIYTSDARGQLLALERDTGITAWTWKHRDAQLGPPVRAGGSILVGDVAGTLHAVDRFSGELRWSYQPTDGTHLTGIAIPVSVEGRQVVFPTAGGPLYSLVADTGSSPDMSEEPAKRRDRALGW